MAELVKWLLVCFIALNAIIVVKDVGKPRGPIRRGTATAVVVINAAIIVAILAFWGGGNG